MFGIVDRRSNQEQAMVTGHGIGGVNDGAGALRHESQIYAGVAQVAHRTASEAVGGGVRIAQ
jgi:hypothetical protein